MRHHQVYRRDVITFACSSRAGELPLAIGQLKANGCKVDLYGNKGFTLSSDISAVMDALAAMPSLRFWTEISVSTRTR